MIYKFKSKAAALQVLLNHLGSVHSRGCEQAGDMDERPAVFPGRRRIHRDEARAAGRPEAEIAPEARVRGRRGELEVVAAEPDSQPLAQQVDALQRSSFPADCLRRLFVRFYHRLARIDLGRPGRERPAALYPAQTTMRGRVFIRGTEPLARLRSPPLTPRASRPAR